MFFIFYFLFLYRRVFFTRLCLRVLVFRFNLREGFRVCLRVSLRFLLFFRLEPPINGPPNGNLEKSLLGVA